MNSQGGQAGAEVARGRSSPTGNPNDRLVDDHLYVQIMNDNLEALFVIIFATRMDWPPEPTRGLS